MTKDQYDSLTDGERVVYDEMTAWSKKVVERLDALTALMVKAVSDANA